MPKKKKTNANEGKKIEEQETKQLETNSSSLTKTQLPSPLAQPSEIKSEDKSEIDTQSTFEISESESQPMTMVIRNLPTGRQLSQLKTKLNLSFKHLADKAYLAAGQLLQVAIVNADLDNFQLALTVNEELKEQGKLLLSDVPSGDYHAFYQEIILKRLNEEYTNIQLPNGSHINFFVLILQMLYQDMPQTNDDETEVVKILGPEKQLEIKTIKSSDAYKKKAAIYHKMCALLIENKYSLDTGSNNLEAAFALCCLYDDLDFFVYLLRSSNLKLEDIACREHCIRINRLKLTSILQNKDLTHFKMLLHICVDGPFINQIANICMMHASDEENRNTQFIDLFIEYSKEFLAKNKMPIPIDYLFFQKDYQFYQLARNVFWEDEFNYIDPKDNATMLHRALIGGYPIIDYIIQYNNEVAINKIDYDVKIKVKKYTYKLNKAMIERLNDPTIVNGLVTAGNPFGAELKLPKSGNIFIEELNALELAISMRSYHAMDLLLKAGAKMCPADIRFVSDLLGKVDESKNIHEVRNPVTTAFFRDDAIAIGSMLEHGLLKNFIHPFVLWCVAYLYNATNVFKVLAEFKVPAYIAEDVKTYEKNPETNSYYTYQQSSVIHFALDDITKKTSISTFEALLEATKDLTAPVTELPTQQLNQKSSKNKNKQKNKTDNKNIVNSDPNNNNSQTNTVLLIDFVNGKQDGITAIAEALGLNKMDHYRILRKYSKPITAAMTPLHFAATLADAKELKKLCEEYPELINIPSQGGSTPLSLVANPNAYDIAKPKEKLECAKILMANGANPIANDQTHPLYIAAHTNNLAFIKLYAQTYPVTFVNCADHAIKVAAKEKQHDAAKLIQAKLDEFKKTNNDLNEPRPEAIRSVEQSNIESRIARKVDLSLNNKISYTEFKKLQTTNKFSYKEISNWRTCIKEAPQALKEYYHRLVNGLPIMPDIISIPADKWGVPEKMITHELREIAQNINVLLADLLDPKLKIYKGIFSIVGAYFVGSYVLDLLTLGKLNIKPNDIDLLLVGIDCEQFLQRLDRFKIGHSAVRNVEGHLCCTINLCGKSIDLLFIDPQDFIKDIWTRYASIAGIFLKVTTFEFISERAHFADLYRQEIINYQTHGENGIPFSYKIELLKLLQRTSFSLNDKTEEDIRNEQTSLKNKYLNALLDKSFIPSMIIVPCLRLAKLFAHTGTINGIELLNEYGILSQIQLLPEHHAAFFTHLDLSIPFEAIQDNKEIELFNNFYLQLIVPLHSAGWDLKKWLAGVDNLRRFVEIINTAYLAPYFNKMIYKFICGLLMCGVSPQLLKRPEEYLNKYESVVNKVKAIKPADPNNNIIDEVKVEVKSKTPKHMPMDQQKITNIMSKFKQQKPYFKKNNNKKTAYNHYSQSILSATNQDELYTAFKNLLDKGFYPDSYTINQFIKRLFEFGRYEDALAIYEDTKNKGHLSEHIIHTMIKFSSRFGHYQDIAKDAYQCAIDQNCLNPKICQIMIHSAGTKKDYAFMHTVYEHAVTNDHADASVFTAAVDAAIKCNKFDEAKEIYQRATTTENGESASIYNVLIYGFGQRKDYASFAFIKQLYQSDFVAKHAEISMIRAFVYIACTKKDIRFATQIYQDAFNKNLIDEPTRDAIIYFARINDLSELSKLITRTPIEKSEQFDTHGYAGLIKVALNNNDKAYALKLYHTAIDENAANDKVHSTILGIIQEVNDLELARELYTKIINSNQESILVYHRILQIEENFGKVEIAKRIFSKAKEKQKVDLTTYQIMINVLLKDNLFDEAQKLYAESKQLFTWNLLQEKEDGKYLISAEHYTHGYLYFALADLFENCEKPFTVKITFGKAFANNSNQKFSFTSNNNKQAKSAVNNAISWMTHQGYYVSLTYGSEKQKSALVTIHPRLNVILRYEHQYAPLLFTTNFAQAEQKPEQIKDEKQDAVKQPKSNGFDHRK